MYSNIDDLKNKLDNSRPLNLTEKERLYNDFKIEFTYDSNAIEGSTITLDETYAILEGKITIGGKKSKEYLDTVNHADAFEFLLDIVKNNYDLDEILIKELHSIVLSNDRMNKGVYRKVPVRVGTHIPPNSLEIADKMKQLIEKYNNYEFKHIIEKISIFHLEFETIHPFVDGNGRTGRLLLNFELMKDGYPPINIKFEDREQYYNAFNDYHKTGTPDKMIELVKMRVESSLQNYLKIIG